MLTSGWRLLLRDPAAFKPEQKGACCRTALQLQSNVTDELVGALAPLHYLRDLSLRGCTALTGMPSTGFRHLITLQQLRSIDISNCTGLQV